MALREITPELIAQYEASGSWQQRTLLRTFLEHVERAPDKRAVSDAHRDLTYAELARSSNVLARWLLDTGCASGDVVAVQVPSRAELVIAHLACARADLVFLPLSNHFRRAEIVALLTVARAAVFIQHTDGGEADRAIRDEVPSIRVVGSLAPAGADFSLAEVARTDDDGEQVDRCADPNASHHAMVSSGTTQLPKVSLWTDNNLWFFLSTFARRVGLTADDVAVQIAPANTGSTGYVFPVLAPLLFGASAVMTEAWNATSALDLLAAERPTLATAIPTQIIKMMQDPSIAQRRFETLRVFNNAGAALAPERAAEVERTFGCTIHTCYGASDGGVPAMTSVEDPAEARYTSVGRVVEEGGCRLVDEDMADVVPGAVGEVIWRNATKSLGYLNDPRRTAEAFWGDSWYRSGDLGRFDDAGYLHIVGRVKDVIIRGGQNITPGEVEDLLAQHPAVLDVALVGLPDPVYGQRSCACVVLRRGSAFDLAEAVAYLRRHDLADYKLPESVEVFEALPYNTGHKVIKHELVDTVQRRREATELVSPA